MALAALTVLWLFRGIYKPSRGQIVQAACMGLTLLMRCRNKFGMMVGEIKKHTVMLNLFQHPTG